MLKLRLSLVPLPARLVRPTWRTIIWPVLTFSPPNSLIPRRWPGLSWMFLAVPPAFTCDICLCFLISSLVQVTHDPPVDLADNIPNRSLLLVENLLDCTLKPRDGQASVGV